MNEIEKNIILFYVAFPHLKPSKECESSQFKSKQTILKTDFRLLGQKLLFIDFSAPKISLNQLFVLVNLTPCKVGSKLGSAGKSNLQARLLKSGNPEFF